ncbi:MAG: hypothetical protein ACRCYQ_04900 [Nocardioides sp.]
MNISHGRAATAVLAAAASLAVAGPVAAADGEVIRTGACSALSDWKVKAKPDDGRLEVEGEVDSNVNGQRWRWRIRHNGVIEARGTRVTVAPSGSFEVERKLADRSGQDTFVFRAVHPATGEVCRGVVRI